MEAKQIIARYTALRSQYAARDVAMADILSVRGGDMGKVFPGWFPEQFPKPMVANIIDTAARDLAEVIAPMPSFNCSSASTVSDKARRFADKRTRIANNYIQHSRLGVQMYSGADMYLSFAFLPFVVEADFDESLPRVRIDNPVGAYPEFDRFGRLVAYMRTLTKSVRELCDLYPEYTTQICGPVRDRNSQAQVQLISYHDGQCTAIILPGQGGPDSMPVTLNYAHNPLGRPAVAVATRPGVTGTPRGQFDDVLWVQLARHRFSLLTMEAAEKAVEAPIALPQDVQEVSLGPDAILRTANPDKIRRVPLEVPQAAFAQNAWLENEMRIGARYPEGRSGNVDASIVTGKGVQALMGGFDTQVKTAQAVLSDTLADVIGICFQMDETLWPNKSKTVRVKDNGTPYEITYKPSKDINGDHTVDVSYGLMAGLDPNRALIFGLQARGDNLISRDFLRRQMPWSMDVTEEEQRVDTEQMRDALKQALAAYAQAIPVYAQQGLDPSDAVYKIAAVIDGRRKGKPIEELVVEAFAPEPEEQPTIADQTSALMGGPPGMAGMEQMMEGEGGAAPMPGGMQARRDPNDVDIPQGMSASGLLNGVAPGQAGMPAGGGAPIQTLLAGLDSRGRPNIQASVSRRVPVR